jgi:hypothetical protein
MGDGNIREQLHNYIDRADQRHLQAIFTLLEKEINDGRQYDKETAQMLLERRNNHLNGASKSYTAKESLDFICSQKG